MNPAGRPGQDAALDCQLTDQLAAPVTLRYDTTMTDVGAVAALVFGQLAELAAPVLTHYHSDLYHDALWLHEYLHGRQCRFYWSLNESGTTIGADPEWVAYAGRRHRYRVEVVLADGRARMTMTRMEH